VPIPNHPDTAKQLLAQLPIEGVLLTGGAPDPRRDATQQCLIKAAEEHVLPVLGVCHGMQTLQRFLGITLETVKGHVTDQQEIAINDNRAVVNSYHDYGTTQTVPELKVWAKADDGVVKAVRHLNKPWLGIMWHPERMDPFAERDIALFREHFK
jgi:putative glutamine amidotransferase